MIYNRILPNKIRTYLAASVGLCMASTSLHAQDTGPSFEGGITVIAQDSNDDKA